MEMAKDVIYIHDWWLSPELYLRRPAEGNQKWRIDRVLKRKAEQGVKIFVVVYRNVGTTVPIDSFYTKHSLLDLHENIYFMRSPNQLIQNTYFWAHHEKLCLIDHTVAFVGGLDLCFGRWDTPDHVLVDDSQVPFHASKPDFNSIYEKTSFQMWPGKDYSNPRTHDFSELDRPYVDMYDRTEVPRMPWHDIHMMVTGQSARDISRHFVQRWNYLLRQKRPSRLTPMLLPPAELTEDQLLNANLEGTCEVQFLRSSCAWSLGLKTPEHSIQNAYLKAIEQSSHFVYIENQFFITSTYFERGGTKIENRIGDALVERIMRAHKNQEKWKAVIVIPLMPGFESEVDEKQGLSVRVIMQCQFLSISCGFDSIFGRLHTAGIAASDYIQFFSLRKWGKIGPKKKLVTEQLYIHSKAMVVDDRIAIIGSANINERSMRGTRDSEIAAIIRDTLQVDSQMGGRPFAVGKFAHTLRLRLMREHLGVDVDQVDLVERIVDREIAKLSTGAAHKLSDFLADMKRVMPDLHDPNDIPIGDNVELHSFNHFVGSENIGFKENKPLSKDPRVQDNQKHREDVDGLGFDGMRNAEAAEQMGVKQSPADIPPDLESKAEAYLQELLSGAPLEEIMQDLVSLKRKLYFRLQSEEHGYEETEPRFFPAECEADDCIFEYRTKASKLDDASSAEKLDGSRRYFPVDPYSMTDPLMDDFYYNTWERIADQNTLYFREVFHCQPDDEVTKWSEYKAFKKKYDDFALSQGLKPRTDVLNFDMPDENATGNSESSDSLGNGQEDGAESKTEAASEILQQRRKVNTRSTPKTFASDEILPSDKAEHLLQGVRGNLVFFPTNWLGHELHNNNWQHSIDHLPPLEIYD